MPLFCISDLPPLLLLTLALINLIREKRTHLPLRMTVLGWTAKVEDGSMSKDVEEGSSRSKVEDGLMPKEVEDGSNRSMAKVEDGSREKELAVRGMYGCASIVP